MRSEVPLYYICLTTYAGEKNLFFSSLVRVTFELDGLRKLINPQAFGSKSPRKVIERGFRRCILFGNERDSIKNRHTNLCG